MAGGAIWVREIEQSAPVPRQVLSMIYCQSSPDKTRVSSNPCVISRSVGVVPTIARSHWSIRFCMVCITKINSLCNHLSNCTFTEICEIIIKILNNSHIKIPIIIMVNVISIRVNPVFFLTLPYIIDIKSISYLPKVLPKPPLSFSLQAHILYVTPRAVFCLYA